MPMVIGSGLGSALSRDKSGQVGALHWIPAAAGSVALVALAILILLPARTPAILAPDGGPLPGSIAELTTVRIGGHDQALMIHAASPDKPVLRVTDQRLYQDMLALAEQRGDAELANQMRAYGEPPYADIPYANAFVMGYYEQMYEPYTPPQAYLALGEKSGLDPYGVLGSEYNLVEKVNVLRGLMDMFTIMYPQLQHIDFRQDVPRLDVPGYILDGEAELSARRDLALEWFDQLEAPSKHHFSFENAAHSVAFEQFEQLHSILLDIILPETYQR